MPVCEDEKEVQAFLDKMMKNDQSLDNFLSKHPLSREYILSLNEKTKHHNLRIIARMIAMLRHSGFEVWGFSNDNCRSILYPENEHHQDMYQATISDEGHNNQIKVVFIKREGVYLVKKIAVYDFDAHLRGKE